MSATSLDFIIGYKVAGIYEVCVVLIIYLKIESSNTSRLEAHAGVFRLLMKHIFDTYDKLPWLKHKKVCYLKLELPNHE